MREKLSINATGALGEMTSSADVKIKIVLFPNVHWMSDKQTTDQSMINRQLTHWRQQK